MTHPLAGFEGPGPLELLTILLGVAVTIGFWAAVIFVVAKLIKRQPRAVGSGSTGLRVLEERYARGEISRDEFLERRAVLSGTRAEETARARDPAPAGEPRCS